MRGDDDEIAGGTKIQFDQYGIKATVSPSAAGEEDDPRSWREVASAINADLRSISVGVFRFIKETLKSATRIVRGVGDVPSAVTSRIRRAHDEYDRIEASKQLGPISGSQKRLETGDREAALQRVKTVLDKKRVEGLTVRVYSDGQQTVIWISRPLGDDDVEEIVQASLKASSEKALPASAGET